MKQKITDRGSLSELKEDDGIKVCRKERVWLTGEKNRGTDLPNHQIINTSGSFRAQHANAPSRTICFFQTGSSSQLHA